MIARVYYEREIEEMIKGISNNSRGSDPSSGFRSYWLQNLPQWILVGARGFEPRTPCAQGRCATRLRYAPTVVQLTGDSVIDSIINDPLHVTFVTLPEGGMPLPGALGL
jgi:hypothetical protein